MKAFKSTQRTHPLAISRETYSSFSSFYQLVSFPIKYKEGSWSRRPKKESLRRKGSSPTPCRPNENNRDPRLAIRRKSIPKKPNDKR
jgi:hypothetical protein